MHGHSDSHSPLPFEVVASALSLGLTNARERGAPWQTLAEEFLGTTEQILKGIQEIRLDLLCKQAAPAQAVNEMNETITALLERLADAVWVERGQSPHDPFISILSPGTPNFFFDWSIGRPVDRIGVLLDMFADRPGPPMHSPEVMAILKEIRVLLPNFQILNESVRAFRAKLEILDKANEVIARIGHVQYTRLRRRMRADGFDAFEVRKVFPDMPGVSAGTLG